MKKIKIFLSAFVMLTCFYGCIREGGYSYRNIYILEGEELIDAQNYKVTLPKNGDSFVLEVVSLSEDLTCGAEKPNKWLTVTMQGKAEKFTYKEDEKRDWYMQKVSFSATANNSGVRRSEKITAIAHIYNGFAAKIKVTQSK